MLEQLLGTWLCRFSPNSDIPERKAPWFCPPPGKMRTQSLASCFKTVHSMGPVVKVSRTVLLKFSFQRVSPVVLLPLIASLVPLLVTGLRREENREPQGVQRTGDRFFSNISGTCTSLPPYLHSLPV